MATDIIARGMASKNSKQIADIHRTLSSTVDDLIINEGEITINVITSDIMTVTYVDQVAELKIG